MVKFTGWRRIASWIWIAVMATYTVIAVFVDLEPARYHLDSSSTVIVRAAVVGFFILVFFVGLAVLAWLEARHQKA